MEGDSDQGDMPAELTKQRGRPRKDKGKHRESSGGVEEAGFKSTQSGAKTTKGKKKEVGGNMASSSTSENQDDIQGTSEATTAKMATKGKGKVANVTDEEGQIHGTCYDTRYHGRLSQRI